MKASFCPVVIFLLPINRWSSVGYCCVDIFLHISSKICTILWTVEKWHNSLADKKESPNFTSTLDSCYGKHGKKNFLFVDWICLAMHFYSCDG